MFSSSRFLKVQPLLGQLPRNSSILTSTVLEAIWRERPEVECGVCVCVCFMVCFLWMFVFGEFGSANGQLLVWVGGLDSWNPLVKGIVTWVYP